MPDLRQQAMPARERSRPCVYAQQRIWAAWKHLFMIEVLAQIKSERFTAGIVLWDDMVIEAAPILFYMKKGKWTRDRVRAYCLKKDWKIEVVHKLERGRP